MKQMVYLSLGWICMGWQTETKPTQEMAALSNLIGRWTTLEKTYNLKGDSTACIQALTACAYVLGSSHISLIGYQTQFETNDETSIWYISYMPTEKKYAVRGLLPEIGRMEEFMGHLQDGQLVVSKSWVSKQGSALQFRFEIDLRQSNQIHVRAIRKEAENEVCVRDELWNRINP